MKEKVSVEENQVLDKAEKVKEMKAEADKILQEALPTLRGAQEALNTLNRNDISEIKSNNNPHALVKFTLECVAILVEEKPDWDNIKRILADPNFLSRMKGLDVYNIPPNTQSSVKKKIKSNPDFTPTIIKGINFAAKSMCEWVRSVANFTDINKDIEKKKNLVESMNKELETANKDLQLKRDELNKIIKKVNELEELYMKNKGEKDRLENDMKVTEQRLENANQLTQGLADEQVRWKETVELLTEDLKLLIGNVFIAGASVSYYGSFSGDFREAFVSDWKEKCVELEIPVSEKYSLEKILGKPMEVAVFFLILDKGMELERAALGSGLHQQRHFGHQLQIGAVDDRPAVAGNQMDQKHICEGKFEDHEDECG